MEFIRNLLTHRTSPHQTTAYRWVILALLFSLYAAFGLVNRAIAPLVTPIIADLDISFAQMGLILGAWQITYILISLINGPVIDRWGIRKSIFAGTVVIGLSAILRFYPTGFLSMLFAVALFGVGGPMISIGGPKAISLWFEGDSRSTAMGIFMAGSILGGLIGLSVTNSLVMPLTDHSWRLTFVYYGILTIVIAFMWLIFARERTYATKVESDSFGVVFIKLFKIRKVRIILLIGLCSFAILHGLGSWLPKILETGGLSPSMAGLAAALPAVSSLPAIIIIPRLVPGRSRETAIALFGLTTSIIIQIIIFTSGLGLISGLVLLGISTAGFLPIILLILMDSPEIGSDNMGAAGGMFFCVAEIGGVLGPFIMGALVDLTGAFVVGALFLTGLGLIVSVLAWSLK